jgi:hypothetical protein
MLSGPVVRPEKRPQGFYLQQKTPFLLKILQKPDLFRYFILNNHNI